MSGDVLVVGDLMVDVVVVASGPLVHGSDTPAEIRSIGGGAAANTACWLASLGRPVRLVAAIGDDAIGHGAVDQLEAAGVRFAGSVDPTRASGSCVVLVDPDGERTMLPDRGANDALPVATVEAAMADRPDGCTSPATRCSTRDRARRPWPPSPRLERVASGCRWTHRATRRCSQSAGRASSTG